MKHISQSVARGFIVTPYMDVGGVLEAVVPSVCPCGYGKDGPCRIGVHHHRSRKTGPEHDLLVVYCHVHDVHFTLYPPGYTPYGRKPIASVAPDGGTVRRAAGADLREGRDDSPGPGVTSFFSGTQFEAAVDAAAGEPWERGEEHLHQGLGGSERYWSTQLRQLSRCTRVVGVAEDLDDLVREQIAEALGLDLLLLREQCASVRRRPGYRSRGRAVCGVLEALGPGRCMVERLMQAGHLAGLWGRPLRWDPRTGALREAPFRILPSPGGR